MLEQKEFPTVSAHSDCRCFSCEGALTNPQNFGFAIGRGRFGAYCADCRVRTYYDTAQNLCGFCGSTAEPVDEGLGYPFCPDCKGV
jgi:hypothetical protein